MTKGINIKKKRKSHVFKVKETYSDKVYYNSQEEFDETLKPFIREIIKRQRQLNCEKEGINV